jgi:hypothetical protein
LGICSYYFKKSWGKWTTTLNLTIPRNKLISFPNIEQTPYAAGNVGVIIGQPLGVSKVYAYGGVDTATGKYMILDANGNPSFTGSSVDRNTIVNTLSKVYGGLGNSIQYKGVQLDFLFQFVIQKGPRQLYWQNETVPGRFSSGFSNQPVTVLDRWQKPGDGVSVGRFTTSNSFFTVYPISSDIYYDYNASYIRLKNISLSWQLSNKLLSKMHLQGMRLYIQGQNVATITKFTGLDPESQSTTTLPPLKLWTVGLQFDF